MKRIKLVVAYDGTLDSAQLADLADQAMYKAKHAGRNQVAVL